MVKFKIRKFKNGSYFITVPKIIAEQLVARGYVYAEWELIEVNKAFVKFKHEGY